MKSILRAGAGAAVLLAAAACASQPAVQGPTPEEIAAQEARARAEAEEAARKLAAERAAAEAEARRKAEAEAERLRRLAEQQGPKKGSVQDFIQQAGERVYFDLNQWRLDEDDKDVLKRQAAWLQSYPSVRVQVGGHCDERGTREYNLALGERRASVVKDYLVSLGIDAVRIETVSYGKERPIDPRSNAAGWAANRNGHTQIVSGAVSS